MGFLFVVWAFLLFVGGLVAPVILLVGAEAEVIGGIILMMLSVVPTLIYLIRVSWRAKKLLEKFASLCIVFLTYTFYFIIAYLTFVNPSFLANLAICTLVNTVATSIGFAIFSKK